MPGIAGDSLKDFWPQVMSTRFDTAPQPVCYGVSHAVLIVFHCGHTMGHAGTYSNVCLCSLRILLASAIPSHWSRLTLSSAGQPGLDDSFSSVRPLLTKESELHVQSELVNDSEE